MDNAKPTPCKVAWEKYRVQPCDLKGEVPCSTFIELAFSAGFRAGEEGKAELVEALEFLTKGMDRAGGDSCGMSVCPWCGAEGESGHVSNCELVRSRAVLAKHKP